MNAGPRKAVLCGTLCACIVTSACIPIRTTDLEGAERRQIRSLDYLADVRRRFGAEDAATTDGRFVLYSLEKQASWQVLDFTAVDLTDFEPADVPREGVADNTVGLTHVLLEFDAANENQAVHFHHCDFDSKEPLCALSAAEILWALVGETYGQEEAGRQRAAESQHAALAVEIHAAAESGDIERISELVSAGASLTSRLEGLTPMHRAAQSGRTEAVAYFIGQGIPVDARTAAASKTALHLAAGAGHTTTVNWLLAHGTRVDSPDIESHTPLRDAIAAGELATATRLVNVGADVNADPGDILILATEHGDLGLVSNLVDHGADLDSSSGINGGSALYYAVHRHFDIAKLLLERGANVNAGLDQYDPLHEAIDLQDIAMVELLLDHGANPNKRVRVRGIRRVTPIDRARSLGADDIVELLMRYGGRS